MTFYTKKYYKNRNMLDCMIRVLFSWRRTDSSYILSVDWMTKNGRRLGREHGVVIKTKYLHNWYPADLYLGD